MKIRGYNKKTPQNSIATLTQPRRFSVRRILPIWHEGLGHNCRPIRKACKLRTDSCLKAIPFHLTAGPIADSFPQLGCIREMLALDDCDRVDFCASNLLHHDSD